MHSLRLRFLAVSLLTHLLVALAMLAAMARLAGSALQDQFSHEAQHVGALLSPALVPLLIARDYAGAEELLQDLTQGGVLVYVQLIGNQGQVQLSAGQVPPDMAPPNQPPPLPLLSGSTFHAEQALTMAGRAYGRVHYGIPAQSLTALRGRVFGWLLAIGAGGLLLAGTLQWLLSRQLTRRLERVTAAADRLAAGAPDQPLDATGTDEAARLADSFNRMAAALQQRFTDLQHSRWQLEQASAALERSNSSLEKRVTERTLELQLARDEAERASRAKSEFLSRMSHELRTPLNAILGFAQILRLQQTERDAGASQQLAHIEQAGWHLLELINEVLDLARIEAGTMAVSNDSLALAPLVAECVSMVRPQAQRLGLEVQDRCQALAGTHVAGDATRLRQVLVNLLSNACKYNRPGGSVTVSARALSGTDEGTEAAAGDWIEVAVADTGIGLTPAQQASLFEPFNRLGAETSAVDGTGIGLVITRRLVELMHGRLGVESEAGVGSTFRIRLRRADRVAPAAALPAAAGSAPQARLVLLYVEDNRSNVDVMQALVQQRAGVVLRLAGDGPAGLQQAVAGGIDAAVVDIALPGMDGVTLCRRMRALPGWSHRPIVALSANAMPNEVQRGLEAGFDQYFTKPIDVARFMRWLDDLLERHRDHG